MTDQILRIKNFRLPSWNEFYAGKHWGSRKREVDLIHKLIVAEIKDQKIRPLERCSLKFTIKIKDSRRHDIDNYAVKFVIDSLVIAGVIVDDDIEHIPSYFVSGKLNSEMDEVIVLLEQT